MIESLPTEILEQIFLLSLNFNLPRVSPYLAGKLSREGIYKTLILMAFWEDNAPFVRPVEEEDGGFLRQFGPYEYSPMEESEQEELQAAVLNSRWCTVARLRKYLPKLDDVFLERYWFGQGALGAGAAADKSSRDHIKAALMDPLACTLKNMPTRYGEMELLISANFIRIYKGHRLVQDFMRAPAIRRIPDELIYPKEYTESSLEMLEFLIGCVELRREEYPVRGGLPRLNVSQEALDKGIHHAIVNGNYRVLRALVEVHELAWWGDTEPLRYEWGDVTHHTISLHHFETAAEKCNDLTAMKILARSSAESCPILETWFKFWANDVGSQAWDLLEFLSDTLLWNGIDWLKPPIFRHGKLHPPHLEEQSGWYERLFGQRPQLWKVEILPNMFSWLSLVERE